MEPLQSYNNLKTTLPSTASQISFVEHTRNTIRSILNGTDSRLLLIVGPCSIHDIQSAKDYAFKLKELAQEVSSDFLIVMRTYFEKPRTSSGWKGFLYDPTLDGSHQIHLGIEQSRKLLLELAEIEVAAATEFLDPFTAFYYDDLISWGSIGARTSSSQPHRQLSSSLPMPIGFKNCVAGNITSAIHGVIAASQPQIFIGLNAHGQASVSRSLGNPDCHIVLRGGNLQPNYDKVTIAKALSDLEQSNLPQRLLIDCSHQNSGKNHQQQPVVLHSILEQVVKGNSAIKGMMLESHIHAGNQPLGVSPSSLQYGISITDGCLDWESTYQLILEAAKFLQKHSVLINSFKA
jgi:3-deoxy-7-phosphoheptulonate synthase